MHRQFHYDADSQESMVDQYERFLDEGLRELRHERLLREGIIEDEQTRRGFWTRMARTLERVLPISIPKASHSRGVANLGQKKTQARPRPRPGVSESGEKVAEVLGPPLVTRAETPWRATRILEFSRKTLFLGSITRVLSKKPPDCAVAQSGGRLQPSGILPGRRLGGAGDQSLTVNWPTSFESA